MKDYLHLEPIGFVFLIGFGGLLITQSIGMFVHRFSTFSQILSNTVIDWSILKKDVCFEKTIINSSCKIIIICFRFIIIKTPRQSKWL